ncbi:MAG: hypothetical protein ACI92S_005343 [Planctomycetaceae bacterium]
MCRRGQLLEFAVVMIARRSPRLHTASFVRPAGHTLRLMNVQSHGAITQASKLIMLPRWSSSGGSIAEGPDVGPVEVVPSANSGCCSESS